MGHGATPEAVTVAQTYGVDLQNHASQPLTRPLLQQADALFAMTNNHLRALQIQFPHTADYLQTLSPLGDDIADPIGSGPEVYERCAGQIMQCLQERLPAILASANRVA
jgi:protein-tyrosine phosphatase